ncbi:uncharacterized protein K489DRAFT_384447 [Dissoconium aciculare CBS 342.82]|uniref:Uncharacterized protein n=1 Tax=Dissoconium aciculare CBS 342.82 TaxID=1314786 RepID=A0A6J3LT33_9PEZI|nr:uncharacterized protein K489DRAFT_384447 [Dissoconium aciculare CBS 342.82]KAF1818945.1 hypothetical protein K489DRAFT_384447 [Dissoconium aciculare CBS 342.82]
MVQEARSLRRWAVGQIFVSTIPSIVAGVAQSVERVALIIERTTSRSRVRAPPSAIPITATLAECDPGQGSILLFFKFFSVGDIRSETE